MNEQEKDKSRQIFEEMLNMCCCNSCPCNACVHKNVCKRIEERPEQCENYNFEVNYKIHSHIDQLFQPIFKWIQHHYPSGGVCFYVDESTAKMKIDHGPYVFEDKYKTCSLQAFNSQMQKTENTNETSKKEDTEQ